MAVSIAPQFSQRIYQWTAWKVAFTARSFAIQYDDDGTTYTIWGYDDVEVHLCTIWKGTLPDSIITGGYSQAQNDADKTDFVTNYLPTANVRIAQQGTYLDPRIIHRFGNLTATSTAEVLVCVRTYNEPASQAQRSVKSSSASDTNTAGAGVKQVRITYLNSSYVLATEDVLLNGTTAVNTVATDIRFIEKFEVVKGAAAVGAVELFPNTGGTGTAICGIGSGSADAFLGHHYVPVGKRAWVVRWGATVDDDTSFKLTGQDRFNGNLVDRVLDLEKLASAATSPDSITFERNCLGLLLPEKTYVRITAVPSQATSTIIRARLDLWEIPL